MAKLTDDDGRLLGEIEALRPTRLVDESPRGRLVGIEWDEWWTYVEMHALLVTGPPAGREEAFVVEVQDLAGRLVELHRKAELAFWAVFAANPPWQRCH
ncbi:MAG: hypothetical protein ACREQ5_00390 [Candidatus Dormibacteria bacterium]